MTRIEEVKPINTKARNRRGAEAVVSPTQLGRAIALALSTFFSGQALGAGEGDAQALTLADAGTNGHYRLIRLLEVGAIRASQALISDSAAASDSPAQSLHLASLGQVPPEITATPATDADGLLQSYLPSMRASTTPAKSASVKRDRDIRALEREYQKTSAVYLDSRGNPTIGIGFNLRDSFIREEVLKSLQVNAEDPHLFTEQEKAREKSYEARITAILRASHSNASALRGKLDAIMKERANDPVLAVLGEDRVSHFRFDGVDDPRLRAVFNSILGAYEQQVQRWAPGHVKTGSREHVALVSMAFNSKVHGRNDPRTSWNENGIAITLGGRLRTAIMNDDRAEAWYEIRYNTNPDGKRDKSGIAKRRFIEADTFGLYESEVHSAADLSADAAKRALRAYTRHRIDIVLYERQHKAAFRNALAVDPATVKPLKTWLQPARTRLIEQYVLGRGIDVGITGEVLVGEDATSKHYRKNDADTGVNALKGTDKSDLIVGESGDDLLNGGRGDDVLYGGAGKDTLQALAGSKWLFGGEGKDRYEIGMRVPAIIEDSDDSGVLVLGGRELSGGARAADGAYVDEYGARYVVSGGSLKINGHITVKNFRDGALGVHLDERMLARAELAPKPVAVAPVSREVSVSKRIVEDLPVRAKTQPKKAQAEVVAAKPVAVKSVTQPLAVKPVARVAELFYVAPRKAPVAEEQIAVLLPTATPVSRNVSETLSAPAQAEPSTLSAPVKAPKRFVARGGRPGSFR